MEEAIRAIRLLWQERRASFVGDYFEFHDVESFPKPVQCPLPIVIAGGVKGIVERVGRVADGWIDTYSPPQRLRERVGQLHAAALGVGRQGPFEVMRSFYCAIAGSDEAAERIRNACTPGGTPTGPPNTAEREFLLVGSPKCIVAQLDRYLDCGLTEINIAFYHRDIPTALEQATMFANEVIPAFGSRR